MVQRIKLHKWSVYISLFVHCFDWFNDNKHFVPRKWLRMRNWRSTTLRVHIATENTLTCLVLFQNKKYLSKQISSHYYKKINGHSLSLVPLYRLKPNLKTDMSIDWSNKLICKKRPVSLHTVRCFIFNSCCCQLSLAFASVVYYFE